MSLSGVGHLAERVPARRVVAVALSGGVDSAVAAALLAAASPAADVVCLHARVWDAADEVGGADDAAASGAPPPACAADADAAAAARVAAALRLPLTTVDAVAPYWMDVFEPFVAGYASGATPNPDLGCNVAVKFGALLAAARAAGADALATGHYARLARRPGGGPPRLLRGADRAKDQTYFLAGVPGAALAGALFPVGGMTKAQVRACAAADAGLAFLLDRRSSAGICFVGRRRFGAFMAGYAAPVAGQFRAVRAWEEVRDARPADAAPATPSLWAGPPLAPCPDVLALTLGQGARVGGAAAPLFVVGKDVPGRTALVAPGRAHAALFSPGAALGAPAWVSGRAPPGLEEGGGVRVEFQARYRAAPRRGTLAAPADPAAPPFRPSALVRLAGVRPPPPPALTLAFDAPVRGVTPGQAVVLYDGDECLGAAPVLAAAATLHERGEGVPAGVASAADADAEEGWGGGG